MTQGIKSNEPDPRIVYADIIDHPHWQSPTRPHMSLYDRSAQFSSYKALSGYEDMVAEEARLTDTEVELEETEMELLNHKLSLIADVIADGEHPALTFTVFIPDQKKAGGKYIEVTDRVKRLDMAAQKVILMTTEGRGKINRSIEFKNITAIHGDLVDYLDDCVWEG